MSPCDFSAGGACSFVPHRSFSDGSDQRDGSAVQVCTTCGIGVTHPLMDDVASLYADRSSQDFQQNAVGLARLIKSSVFKRDARRLLSKLEPRPLTVIDYGCGGGLYTRMMGDFLGAGNVIGVDFHEASPPELSDRPYMSHRALAASSVQVDALSAFHVLEHDPDPMALLSRMSSVMKPGAHLVIEVPNIDCVFSHWVGRKWDAWYLPFHRYYFSCKSLIHLIEAGGFEIEKIEGACIPSMGRTLAKIAGRQNTLLFLLAGAALHPFQMLVEKLTGQPSGLRVFARKRG